MASITRYVNTASTPGGDGTTNGTSGANRAFATLFDAQAAMIADYTSTICDIPDEQGDNTIALRIICSGSAADTTRVNINAGYVTDPTHRIQFLGGAPGPEWDDTQYRLTSNVAFDAGTLQIDFAVHLTLTNMQIECTSPLDQSPHAIRLSNYEWGLRIVGGSYRITGTTGAWNEANVIQINQAGIGSFYARNTVFAAADGIAIKSTFSNGQPFEFIIYNSTLVNQSATNRAVLQTNYTSGSFQRIKNVILQGTTGATKLLVTGSTMDSASILTQDDSSPDAALRNLTVTFVSSSAWNYNVSPDDVSTKDVGTDLSAVASWPFSTDSRGRTRQPPWSLGPKNADLPFKRGVSGQFTGRGQTVASMGPNGNTATIFIP